MAYHVEMHLGAVWVPMLDANDANGAPYTTLWATEVEATNLMEDLKRDPEFSGEELRVQLSG